MLNQWSPVEALVQPNFHCSFECNFVSKRHALATFSVLHIYKEILYMYVAVFRDHLI